MNPAAAHNIIPFNTIFASDIIASGGENLKYLMTQLENIYGEGRRWNVSELHEALELSRVPTLKEECESIARYYKSLPNTRLFPHSVMRLLQGWNEACDKARTALKPRGTMKNPVEVNERNMLARMAYLRARSFNEDNRVWREDIQAVSDRSEFNTLRERLKQPTNT